MKPNLSVTAAVLLGTFAAGYWLGFHSGGESGWLAGGTPPGPQVSPAPGKTPKSKTAKGLGSDSDSRNNSEGHDANSSAASLAALLKKANDMVRSSDLNNPAFGLKMVSLLNGIPTEEIPEALAQIEQLRWPDEAKGISFLVLLCRLAETNGPAAIAYAEEKMTLKDPMINSGILSAWAEHDPAAAWSHYLDRSSKDKDTWPTSDNPYLSSLFSIFAAQDENAALNRLADLKNPQDRIQALAGIVQGAGRDEASQLRLLKDLTALPDADESIEARCTLLAEIARENPDKAIALVNTLPGSERWKADDAVSAKLMETNPRLGAAFLLDNRDPQEDLADTYYTIIRNWGGKEPAAAGAWLNEQPQGPDLDNARLVFVRQLVGTSPAAALAWAASISEESAKFDALLLAYSSWSLKDAPAAEAALIATGLPADKLDAIRGKNEK